MIETVRIVKDHAPGYAIINKADYDPTKHELYGVEPKEGDGPTRAEIVEKLKAIGVSIPRGARKDELAALLAAKG